MPIATFGGIFPPMETTFRQALKSALETTGKSLRGIAMSSGVSYDQLKSLAQGKSQKTNADDAMKVAAAFGVSLEDFYEGRLANTSIAVAGRVGAGAEIDLFDAHAKGDGLYHVACPPQISPRGIVAVEVVGDSMVPTYQPGTVLFYSRASHESVPTEALGKICVCEDLDGKAWVKHIKPGTTEGTFSLLSVNPESHNMHGVILKWAAPVKLALPPEFVKRT